MYSSHSTIVEDLHYMIASGNLTKMPTNYQTPIEYILRLSEHDIPLNSLIGKKLQITFEGRINCIECGSRIKKSFGQGFCYPCFRDSPNNSECILRPELCEAHLGKGRDVEWEKENHLQPHTVYLAVSSGLKVGITRNTQVPTRWIDQGASQAVVLADVPHRRLSGEIEVALKQHVSDRTNWQRMLKNDVPVVDLLEEKYRLKEYLPEELQQYVSEVDDIWSLEYPVTNYPKKVKSISLDKTPTFHGTLSGIKGQYLMFDEVMVMNIRKHSGYFVTFQTVEESKQESLF